MPSDRYGLSGTYDFDLTRDKKYHASVSLSSIYVTKQVVASTRTRTSSATRPILTSCSMVRLR